MTVAVASSNPETPPAGPGSPVRVHWPGARTAAPNRPHSVRKTPSHLVRDGSASGPIDHDDLVVVHRRTSKGSRPLGRSSGLRRPARVGGGTGGADGGRSIVDDRSQGAPSAAPGWVDATDRPSSTWPRAAGNAPRRRTTGRSPGFSATITAGRCLTPHGPGHPAAGRRNAEPARHSSMTWAQHTDRDAIVDHSVRRAPTVGSAPPRAGDLSYRGPGALLHRVSDGDLGHCR
jgi:hypothetical protein